MSEKLNLLKYEFKNAMIGIKRHWMLCLSSVFTVFLAMLLISVFMVLGLHVNSFSVSSAREMSIHTVLDQGLDEAARQKVYSQIMADENVASAVLSDKDQELEDMIREKGEAFAVYRGENNPLSDAYFVELKDESRIDETAERLMQIEGVYDTAYGGSSVQELIRILNLIRWGSFTVVVLLLGLALFLIYNTIRTTIYSRQNEIGIMWTVGATPSFIRIPFEIEGVLIGLTGALLPFLFILFGYPAAYQALNGRFFVHTFRLIEPGTMQILMGMILFGFGGLAGFAASYLSASKYIRSRHYRSRGTKG